MKNTIIKHLILFMAMMVGIACYADVMPYYVKDVPGNTMGLYQTDKVINVYAKPDAKSAVICKKTINYADYTNTQSDKFFAVMIPAKELAFAYVTDVADDESWVQIIYDKNRNLKGWVKKDDDFQFLPWGTFFDMYARKYGLYRLRDNSGKTVADGVYSQPDKNGQELGKVQNPKFIKFMALEGSWILISELDYMGDTTTGYVEWYTDNGDVLYFPDIK